MLQIYEPFVNRRMAEGRIFYVNSKMPFEFFLDCFDKEKPFFCVSQLEDGRMAITPNAAYFPQNHQYAGQWLPSDYEYVTMKSSTYPVIITAHPVNNTEQWLRKFEQWITPFSKQTLSEFLTGCVDFIPIQGQRQFTSREPIPA